MEKRFVESIISLSSILKVILGFILLWQPIEFLYEVPLKLHTIHKLSTGYWLKFISNSKEALQLHCKSLKID